MRAPRPHRHVAPPHTPHRLPPRSDISVPETNEQREARARAERSRRMTKVLLGGAVVSAVIIGTALAVVYSRRSSSRRARR